LIIINPAVDNISLTDNFSNVAPYTTMVRESSDFTAMKFSVRANNVRDLYLNGFTITPHFDSPDATQAIATPGVTTVAAALNANNSTSFVGDVMVYVDGALVQTLSLPAAAASSVTFNSLGIMIPKGGQKEVVVKVRTYTNHFSDGLNTAATHWDVQYVASVFDIDDSNGNAISTINGSAANIVRVNGHALDVAPGIVVQCNNINPIQSTIIPASTTTSVTVANFEFRSQYGVSLISELAIANVTAAGALVTPTATLVGTYNPSALTPNFDGSADGMILEVYNGATMVGQGQLINAIAYITFTTPVNLPINTSTVLTIKAKSANPITNIGTRSLMLRLVDPNVPVTSFVGGTAQTQVSASGSTANVTAACTNQTANAHQVRATKISFADVVNPNQTTINSLVGVLGTSQTVFKTKITADAAGSAKFYSINFKLDGKLAAAALAAGTISNFKLRVNGTLMSATDMLCTATYGAPTTVECHFIG